MAKNKFKLEYVLKPSSKAILWEYISTPAGFEKWLADEVIENDGQYTFCWGDDERKEATLLTCRPFSHIRFRWTEDKTCKTYFEIRMRKNELTEEHILEITDFALDEDKEDLITLWDSEVDILRRISGI